MVFVFFLFLFLHIYRRNYIYIKKKNPPVLNLNHQHLKGKVIRRLYNVYAPIANYCWLTQRRFCRWTGRSACGCSSLYILYNVIYSRSTNRISSHKLYVSFVSCPVGSAVEGHKLQIIRNNSV